MSALFDALARAEIDARALAGKVVAVIGTGTAHACEARGLRPDLIPKRARAEGLIKGLDARGLLGRRWLHLRADEGRDLLGPAIQAAGGSYELVVAYRTVRPEVPRLLLESMRATADGGEGIDAVCFASGKTARHFLESIDAGLCEGAGLRLLAATRAKIIALGPVTAGAIEALGLPVHEIASDFTDEAMVAAVVQSLSRAPAS